MIREHNRQLSTKLQAVSSLSHLLFPSEEARIVRRVGLSARIRYGGYAETRDFHPMPRAKAQSLAERGCQLKKCDGNEQDCLLVDRMFPCLIKHLTTWAVECMNTWIAMLPCGIIQVLMVMSISYSTFGKCPFPFMSTVCSYSGAILPGKCLVSPPQPATYTVSPLEIHVRCSGGIITSGQIVMPTLYGLIAKKSTRDGDQNVIALLIEMQMHESDHSERGYHLITNMNIPRCTRFGN